MRASINLLLPALAAALLTGACSEPAGPPTSGRRPERAAPPAAASPSAARHGDRRSAGEFVRVATGEGPLTGSIFGSGRAGIVLSPQLNQDRRHWFPLARRLAERGYRAMSIDSGYLDLDGEVLVAAHYLRSHGARWVAAVGASKGGTAALGAAAKGELDAVVAVSPPVSYGDVTLDRRSVASLDEPALVIVDELDGVSLDAEQLGRWGGSNPRVVYLNGGGEHGTSYLTSEKRREFVRMVAGFLARHRSPG